MDQVHIKPDTLKLIEKKLGKTLEDMDTGKKFLNRTLIAYALRSRIDKWDLIKLQSFCKAKDTVKRTKQQPTNKLGKDLHQPYIRQRANILYIQRTQEVRPQGTK